MRKRKTAAALAIALALAAAGPAFAATSTDQLKEQAKVTEAHARATALATVPGGTIQSGELEHENGALVWSFDVRQPKSADIVEVQVDARSGKIVSRKTETPAEQAKEAKTDAVVKTR